MFTAFAVRGRSARPTVCPHASRLLLTSSVAALLLFTAGCETPGTNLGGEARPVVASVRDALSSGRQVKALITPKQEPEKSNIAIILNSGDGSISLVDRLKYREISRFPVGKEPHHLMAEASDKDLIVANAVSNDLVFLNPRSGQIERRLPNVSDPYQIGFSPDHKWFVSASLRLDRVDIYHGNDFSLAKRYELPSAPSHIAFNADSSISFITLQDSNQVAAIDLAKQTVLWTIPVGRQPAGIWMTPDNQFLFVGIMGADYAEVIDWRAKKTVAKIVTGPGAHQFLHIPGTDNVLVSNRVAGTVTIVDYKQRKVLDQIHVPGGPDCMILTRDQRELWVTSRWIKRVSVVDMSSHQVVHSIPVGHSPHGVYLLDHAPLS